MTEPHNNVVKIRVLPSFFFRETLDDKVSLGKSKCLLETDHVKFIVGNRQAKFNILPVFQAL